MSEKGLRSIPTTLVTGTLGTGKTSVIKSISSELDCDLFVLPVTKTMLDSNFVDAFNYINDKSDKNRIVVIEDIDTMFEERKEGDKNNGITMQGFLNCLDGFTCIEGTLVFLTANKPEVLDNAMIRSCRILLRIGCRFEASFTLVALETYPEKK